MINRPAMIRFSWVAFVLAAALAWPQSSSSAPQQSPTPQAQPQAQAGQPPSAYVPKYPGDPARSDAEALALGYMRTLVYAQKLYFKKHAQYATTLAGLVHSGSFTKRMTNPEQGDYTVSFRGRKTKYSLQLTPKVFDAQHRAFWTNDDGIFHAEDDKPATEDSPALKAR